MSTETTAKDLIDKINNVVNALMNEKIDDRMQSILELAFSKISHKNNENWKSATLPLSFTFTFSGYKQTIQVIGLLAMSLVHFHGGYELERVGDSDTVTLRSMGYYYYQDG